jgi:hypothetical protein
MTMTLMIYNSIYVWCSQRNLCCSKVFAIFRQAFIYLLLIVFLALGSLRSLRFGSTCCMCFQGGSEQGEYMRVYMQNLLGFRTLSILCVIHHRQNPTESESVYMVSSPTDRRGKGKGLVALPLRKRQ